MGFVPLLCYMLDLALYLSTLETSPTGESLKPSHKAALLTLALMFDGSAIELTDVAQLSRRIGLGHVKSLPRLLKELVDMELITLSQGRGKDGRHSPPMVDIPAKIKRRSGNLQAPGNQGVTGAGNQGVTGESPVTKGLPELSSGKQRDLRAPGNQGVTGGSGIVLAFKSPPPLNTNIQEGKRVDRATRAGNPEVTGLLEHPAVKVWGEVMQEEITVDQLHYITKRVEYTELWREVLEGWKASRWAKTNVMGQVERYQKQAKDYQPPARQKQKDPIEEERVRRIMYGE